MDCSIPGSDMTDQQVHPDEALETEVTRAALDSVHLEGLEIQSLTQWQLARRKFFQHRLAMTALVILTVVAVAALFADYIAPYPFDAPNVPDRSLARTFEGFPIFGTDK